MFYRILSSLLFMCMITLTHAQIVSISPPFATADDMITITYDANQGCSALQDVVPVFMHTGVVTEAGGAGNWQNVQGTWGQFDTNVLMTHIGGNIHEKSFIVNDFYNLTESDVATELAFVFRNDVGTLEGKDVGCVDFFVPLYQNTSSLLVSITSPAEEAVITEIGENIPIIVNASQASDIILFEDGVNVASVINNDILNHTINVNTAGQHTVIAEATAGGQTVKDTFIYIVNPTVNVAEAPTGTKNGLNRIDNNSNVRLQLYAPGKDYVYVIGDFNDWLPNISYYMNRSADGATWWLDITGLDPDTEYAYQYFVDGELRIADPYSEKILDKWNDPYIPSTTYPNLKPYPNGQTNGIVSSFKPKNEAFNWQNDSFEKIDKEKLVIYELLIRDFSTEQNFQSVVDRLDYLETLGINAIEFMPLNEFEGNESWGYNPSFHMALDKYYGTADAFKTLVDECHARGIAVIVDAVFNHAFSQSPLCQLYWDDVNFKPLPNNPWLNQIAAHPFNVGYDFNHESVATQEWMDQVLQYWIDEYHIDGFRFDLSKGFTQDFTEDVGVWSQYNADRINLLTRMANALWTNTNPDVYVILEHFADQAEERELTDAGMFTWGNENHQFNEGSMGYSSNLSGADYQVSWRNYNNPYLVSYMESHDEERLMYKNLEFGNSGNGGAYDITNEDTALKRQELVGVLAFSIPGPKMIWQFGELGYDYSINHCTDGTIDPNCRLDPKPIRWDYYDDEERQQLYQIWSAMLNLRNESEAFHTTDYNYDLNSKVKWINLNHSSMNVAVIGNFDVEFNDGTPNFQHTGWWYEYFSGDSINVSDMSMTIPLEAGEYRLYTDAKVENPSVSVEQVSWISDLSISPNPSSGDLNIQLSLENPQDVQIKIFDIAGKEIALIHQGREQDININQDMQYLHSGIYLIQIQTPLGTLTKKWIKS